MDPAVVCSSWIKNTLRSLLCMFAVILHIEILRRGDNATFMNTRFIWVIISIHNCGRNKTNPLLTSSSED